MFKTFRLAGFFAWRMVCGGKGRETLSSKMLQAKKLLHEKMEYITQKGSGRHSARTYENIQHVELAFRVGTGRGIIERLY